MCHAKVVVVNSINSGIHNPESPNHHRTESIARERAGVVCGFGRRGGLIYDEK